MAIRHYLTCTMPSTRLADHAKSRAGVGYTEGSGREQWRCRHQVCTGCCCSGAPIRCLPCLGLSGPQPAHSGGNHLPSHGCPPRHQGREGNSAIRLQHFHLHLSLQRACTKYMSNLKFCSPRLWDFRRHCIGRCSSMYYTNLPTTCPG